MNELQLIIRQRVIAQTAVPDNKYRVLIRMQRSDRPVHWNYLCNRCGSKIVYVMNQEVASVDDFFDPSNTTNAAIGRECKGRLENGMPCPYIYFFQLQ